MGSERLGHMFTAKDPTFKEHSSSSKKQSHDPSSSTTHPFSHTSGTQPVCISNGPRSSPSSIGKAAKRLKPNAKYRKLSKLYSRQLLFIGTTIDAIESLSKSMSENEQKEWMLRKQCFNELNERLTNLWHSPANQDHRQFDQIKEEIQHLIEDLKLFKMNHQQSHPTNTLDLLMTIPIDGSESDGTGDEDKDPSKILNYF